MIPTSRIGNKLSADERKLYARMMEVFAGFLEHTDHYIGELIQFLKDLGEYENTLIMLISDNGASAEGGPTGSVNEGRFFNNVPGYGRGRKLKQIDEIGGPKVFNHYPMGLDVRRQYAVPPLEARDLPRRHQRSVHRLLAQGHQGAGRGSHAVLPHHRHGSDGAGCARHRAACADSRRDSIADEGFSLKSTFDDAKAPSTHITQYFEMMGHRSLYHDGWRAVCPWPGTSFTESGRGFGDADHIRHAHRARCQRLGALQR